MSDIFISYSAKDSDLANKLKQFLEEHELSVFLAEISIKPSDKWKDSIISAFRECKWVFFLATPDSCKSTPVMHEIGGALFMQKKMVSLMCDITPDKLPEWVQDTQALDIKDREKVTSFIRDLADAIKGDKFIAGLVVGGLLAFGTYVLIKKG